MAGDEMSLLSRAEERSKELLNEWDETRDINKFHHALEEGMKVVYIAGPYRAKSDEDKWQNIMRARDAARVLWMTGHAVICPHLNSMFMDGEDTAEIFLRGDREILGRCDMVVFLRGWDKSEGAREEHRLAEQLGKEIIYRE